MNRVAQQQPKRSEDEWFNHFESVLGTEPTSAHPVVTDEADPLSVDELDSPITEGEITRALEHLKTNKSPAMDGIYAEMIKNSLPQILPFLVVLFNRIFDSSEYPTAWTSAIIVPIQKSGDKNDPDILSGSIITEYSGKGFCSHLE